MVTMKNPLRKRYVREIRSDFGKYLVIFLLLLVSIGFTSGFLVAADSMIITYNESFEKYNIEDGHFLTQKPLNKAQKKAISAYGTEIFPLFFKEFGLDNGSIMRFFAARSDVNKVCLMEGRMPETDGETAIDRMYASNNHLRIGDRISAGEESWEITGLVALSDYSALFSSNSELMFDAIRFGTGIVTPEAFAAYEDPVPCYAWKYNVPPADEAEEKEISEEFMKVIRNETTLREYVPRYVNQSIRFTGEDMGSDRSSMMVFMYIIVVITGFVYAITVRDTISRESTVIGTLLASGYTVNELTFHYMALPLLVTAVSALAGNLLGYTVFRDVCADLYYESYSLPTYVTRWNANAFLITTIVPCVLMALITFLVIRNSLKLSPLQFLRRDLSRRKNRSAPALSRHIPFFSRFRLRITMQNIPNFIILAIGIFLADVLLFFGIALPILLNNYQESMVDGMLSEYQYILSVPSEALDEEKKTESIVNLFLYLKEAETANETAEKFSAASLSTIAGEGYKSDEISLYGIQENSRYISEDISPGEVWISSLYADKYRLKTGDTFTLKEKYEEKQYTFHVDGILPYEGGLAVFMPADDLNTVFEYPEGMFSGYFSETKITDIPAEYIATVIDYQSLTKVSRQLMHSFGEMMILIDAFSVILFVFLIYLLSKLIIEKNTQSISMTKILGYTDEEISKLYLLSVTLAVTAFVLISYPLCYVTVEVLWRYFVAMKMSGWMRFRVPPEPFVKMFLLAMGSYAVVAVFEYIRIRKIPMDEALKNVE